MRRARVRALLLLVILVGLAVALFARLRERDDALAPRPAARRPTLLFITSLPLLFGEGFSIEGNGSPVLTRLAARYRVVPISVTDASELAEGRLLLMAQPQAQTAENLVALDSWVKKGGRLLLLADPQLEWPSSQPLSDVTRPPFMFMDTGLLEHWGLRLARPPRAGNAERKLGGFQIMTVSPGSLYGTCNIGSDRLVAHCRIGAGTATVVADADFLDIRELGSKARHNLDALLTELALLERS